MTSSKQVKLNFPQTLAYGLSNFHIHAGVRDIFDGLAAVLVGDTECKPWIIEGAERFGKTHLLIALQQLVEREGKRSLLLTFDDLQGFSQGVDWNEVLSGINVCLIDDFDWLLDEVVAWNKISIVVDLFETCKQQSKKLVMSSRRSIVDYTDLDPHARSRISAATWLELGKPAEEDCRVILELLAKQRGLKFSERQVNFLCRRLRQDIASVERYLTRLISWSEVAGEPIKLSNIAEIL